MCKKDDNLFGFAMGILAGVVGGITVGILFAPKSATTLNPKTLR